MSTPPKTQLTAKQERELGDEVIARSKRILALVDVYELFPTAAKRTALRSALMAEFRAAALRDLSNPAPDWL